MKPSQTHWKIPPHALTRPIRGVTFLVRSDHVPARVAVSSHFSAAIFLPAGSPLPSEATHTITPLIIIQDVLGVS